MKVDYLKSLWANDQEIFNTLPSKYVMYGFLGQAIQ